MRLKRKTKIPFSKGEAASDDPDGILFGFPVVVVPPYPRMSSAAEYFRPLGHVTGGQNKTFVFATIRPRTRRKRTRRVNYAIPRTICRSACTFRRTRGETAGPGSAPADSHGEHVVPAHECRNKPDDLWRRVRVWERPFRRGPIMGRADREILGNLPSAGWTGRAAAGNYVARTGSGAGRVSGPRQKVPAVLSTRLGMTGPGRRSSVTGRPRNEAWGLRGLGQKIIAKSLKYCPVQRIFRKQEKKLLI